MRSIHAGALALALALAASPAAAQTAPDPQSRLWDAAVAGDTTALAQALADGAAIDSLDTRRARNGRRALNWAALNDRPDAIAFLVRRGATVNAVNLTGFTPLHHAAEAGSVAAARALIAAGADPAVPNHEGVTPEQLAMQRIHPDVAALIAEAARQGAAPR